MPTEHANSTQHGAPDYDVRIDADELLADLAEIGAEYADDYARYDTWWRQSPLFDKFSDARYWSLEALGGRRAVADAISHLQPEPTANGWYLDDGDVIVRGFMDWLQTMADDAHQRARGPYQQTRQADEAESAYVKMLSLLRDEYGVGWPRLDDVSGNPLECDQP